MHINKINGSIYVVDFIFEEMSSLVSEDETNMASQKFVYTWESPVSERTKNNTKNLVVWSVVRILAIELMQSELFMLVFTFLRE